MIKDTVQIYTDGSKCNNGLSLGTWCIAPDYNYTKIRNLSDKTTIYTAECMAIADAMDFALQYPNKQVEIFTDSLSAVQSLSFLKFKVVINRYIFEIRNKYVTFLDNCEDNGRVTIFWIPSHVGIHGNELADQHAKKATEQKPTHLQITSTDSKPIYKRIATNSTIKMMKNQGLNKGKIYFNYFYSQSSKPLFQGLKLSRDFIVTICRSRSNHYNLNESLVRIKIVPEAKCECGYEEQDLDHVIWQCSKSDNNRTHLLKSLLKIKRFPPFAIKCYLESPNINVLQIIYRYLEKCELHI